MSLIRVQPHDVFDLRRDVSQLFDSVLGSGGPPNYSAPNVWKPAIDVSESANEFILTTDLPGIDRKDIDVSVVDNRLTIKGERKQETQSKDKPMVHRERTYGTFSRVFDLPAAVEAGKIAATYRDGVLSVTVPKVEATKPRQIEVKGSSTN